MKLGIGQTYPWIEDFPPDMADLISFYLKDMFYRNLTPLDSYLNCYDFLFSYFIENLPRVDDPTRFKGQTFFQRLVKDQYSNDSILWDSIKKTAGEIGTVASWIFPVALLFLVIYLVKN